ncbi:MAG: putative PurR-regulated permease PerM, partial [Polaromonas sp.]
MGLPVRQQMSYWGVAAVVFFVLMWAFGDVILPFVVGGAVAYSMDPTADLLERWGLPRLAATIVISLIALILCIIAALLVIPLMIEQLIGLVNVAPELVTRLQSGLSERFPMINDPDSTLRQSLASIGEFIQSKGGAVFQQVFASAISILNTIVFIVVVPVVAFYLLLDWDNMMARIQQLLPRDHAP